MKKIKILLILTLTCLLFSDLTEEEKALFRKNVVIPVPSEIIMALDMISDADWRSVVSYDYSSNYAENYKIALNLGVRVAQGFIAIQAQDRRNTGEMFLISRDLAENFGARSEMFVDRNHITKLLNEGKWLDLRSILDDIHLRVKDEMIKYDPDFVVLAGIGGWLEGMHIVSNALKDNYTEDSSMILHQPELIDHFIESVTSLKPVNLEKPEVKAIQKHLPRIKELTSVGPGNPIPEESIAELYEIGRELNKMIVAGSISDVSYEGDTPGKWAVIYSFIIVALIIIYVSKRKKGGAK